MHLTIDIGTSSVKGGLFSEAGMLFESFHQSLPLETENWNPQWWVDALSAGITSLSHSAEIESVAISGNGPTIVPVFSDSSWGNALLWFQNAGHISRNMRSYFLPRIKRILENEPSVYEKTAVFLTCPGFLSWILTGEQCAVISNREYAPIYWEKEEALSLGLDFDKLPALVHSGDKLGFVTAAGEKRTGIPAGIPVYGGGLDYLMALLGTGTVTPGTACDRAGTSEGINFCSDNKLENPNLRTLPHAIEGYYHISGILSSTGRVFEWFRQITGQSNRSYIDMMQDICRIDPGCTDPRFFPSNHYGATWEFVSGVFSRLSPSHSRNHMGKAVVDAIGFGIRDVLSVLNAGGCPVEKLYGSGGQMRNPVWTQMKADIIGIPIWVPRVIDAELLGCLCCSLAGNGRYSSVKEAALDLVTYERIYEPDSKVTALYEDSYRSYLLERDRLIAAHLSE